MLRNKGDYILCFFHYLPNPLKSLPFTQMQVRTICRTLNISQKLPRKIKALILTCNSWFKMPNKYKKWCPNGCGKKVTIQDLLQTKPIKYYYQCSKCRAKFKKNKKGNMDVLKNDWKSNSWNKLFDYEPEWTYVNSIPCICHGVDYRILFALACLLRQKSEREKYMQSLSEKELKKYLKFKSELWKTKYHIKLWNIIVNLNWRR